MFQTRPSDEERRRDGIHIFLYLLRCNELCYQQILCARAEFVDIIVIFDCDKDIEIQDDSNEDDDVSVILLLILFLESSLP